MDVPALLGVLIRLCGDFPILDRIAFGALEGKSLLELGEILRFRHPALGLSALLVRMGQVD